MAQQEPMYSQYMFNMIQINPAYAGNRGLSQVIGLYRNQWISLEGAPTIVSLSWDMRSTQNNIGYGLQLYKDQLGVETTTGFKSYYSYRIQFENSNLSFGLSAGVLHYNANLTDVETYIGGDPNFAENVNNLLPTAGFGMLYATDKWYAGFSIPALLNSQIYTENFKFELNKYSNYFLTAGYIFEVSEAVKLKPSFLVKAIKGSPFQFDLNMNAWIQNNFGIGVSYRVDDALVTMFELQIAPDFGIGYAYDYTLSNLKTFSKGTHELMLRYEFGSKRNQKIISPRYY
jgi:type IX secretion system PorP/SprF family membrane protein